MWHTSWGCLIPYIQTITHLLPMTPLLTTGGGIMECLISLVYRCEGFGWLRYTVILSRIRDSSLVTWTSKTIVLCNSFLSLVAWSRREPRRQAPRSYFLRLVLNFPLGSPGYIRGSTRANDMPYFALVSAGWPKRGKAAFPKRDVSILMHGESVRCYPLSNSDPRTPSVISGGSVSDALGSDGTMAMNT